MILFPKKVHCMPGNDTSPIQMLVDHSPPVSNLTVKAYTPYKKVYIIRPTSVTFSYWKLEQWFIFNCHEKMKEGERYYATLRIQGENRNIWDLTQSRVQIIVGLNFTKPNTTVPIEAKKVKAGIIYQED
jgi:hypothetical protein